MSISYLEVHPWMIGTHIGNVIGALEEVEQQTDEMYTAIRELDGMWDGPANQAFNEQFNTDHENLLALCETIRSLSECMQQATTRYYDSEFQVSSIVDAIKI